MEIARDRGALDRLLAGPRRDGARIALVPTMGNLHEGHLSLVRRARGAGDLVVATLFVNPFQFGAGEDLDAYPRTHEADREALEGLGVEVLYMPDASEIYPRGPERITRVEVPGLGEDLEGGSRPTFFRGVATVVCILLNIVAPRTAVFGEKDYQQLLVIKRMVRDLHLPVEVISGPTVREPDGLALSSRNVYLSAEERRRAPGLYQALRAAREAVRGGDRDYQAIGFRGMEDLEARGFRPEYVSVRAADDLRTPEPGTEGLVVLAAAWLGRARLIDNVQA